MASKNILRTHDVINDDGDCLIVAIGPTTGSASIAIHESGEECHLCFRQEDYPIIHAAIVNLNNAIEQHNREYGENKSNG